MNKLSSVADVVLIAGLVLAALFALGQKESWIWKRRWRCYHRLQADRSPLAETEFCRRAGLDLSNAPVVSIIRNALARFGNYDPLRIEPEDAFYLTSA